MTVAVELPVRVDTEDISDHDLDLINRQSIETLTKDDIYIISGICSNDRMDSYLTKMDPTTTLTNYARDLKSGISLLEGHDTSKTPLGRSFNGLVIPSDNDNEINSVRSDFYMIQNTVVNGVNTDHTYRQVRSGILKDFSVGFGGNELHYRCSSCGKDLMDWECPHLPGLEDENGRMVFAWVVNGRLREVSLVYKGATPDAFVTKAREYVGQGELENKLIMRLEREYHVRFDNEKSGSFFMPKKEGNSLNIIDELTKQVRENKIEKGRIYDILTENGDPFRQPDDIEIRNELGKDYTSVSAIRQLKKEAQQGRRYLADMVDDAVSARVKAQGDTFNAESYRSMLMTWGDIDAIKEEAESYRKAAEQRFVGGRQTEEEDPEGNKEEDKKVRTKVDNSKINFFEGDE